LCCRPLAPNVSAAWRRAGNTNVHTPPCAKPLVPVVQLKCEDSKNQ